MHVEPNASAVPKNVKMVISKSTRTMPMPQCPFNGQTVTYIQDELTRTSTSPKVASSKDLALYGHNFVES